MALQVCTSKHHPELRLESPQNPGDQSRISLVFAESTLLGGRKVLAACCTGEKPCPAASTAWSPSTRLCARLSAQPRASSEHRDTMGSSWGWHGVGMAGEAPLLGKGKAAGSSCRYGTNGWRSKSRCSVLPRLRAPMDSAKLEGTHQDPTQPCTGHPQRHILCRRAFPSCSWSSGRLGKAKPSVSTAFATLWKLSPASARPGVALPAEADFGCPPSSAVLDSRPY